MRLEKQTMKNKQKGVVLIVSLLVLLVLTMLGISSMNGSIMEEKMAANTQTAASTFQKAESSIREAFFVELNNPPGAVNKSRSNALPVNHDDSVHGISSESQHVYDPDSSSTPLLNSSAGTFEARRFEIIGTANIDDIRSRNVQGYRVFPVMPQP